jgi:hypothetical protein
MRRGADARMQRSWPQTFFRIRVRFLANSHPFYRWGIVSRKEGSDTAATRPNQASAGGAGQRLSSRELSKNAANSPSYRWRQSRRGERGLLTGTVGSCTRLVGDGDMGAFAGWDVSSRQGMASRRETCSLRRGVHASAGNREVQ